MKKAYKTIIYGILITILFSCASTDNENTEIAHWKETYATLYKYGHGRGAVNMVFYIVDGKRYEVSGYFDVYGKVIGDKYLIKYNPNNPKQIYEYVWYVSFLTTEKTEVAIGQIDDIWSKHIEFGRLRRDGITFSYTVNERIYERTQYLQPDYKERYPNLSNGQKYKIHYWEKNPQRAVLYLDGPIKEENKNI